MAKSLIRRPLPSYEYLHERFEYEPRTGNLIWRDGRFRKTLTGKVAGSLDSKGYVKVFCGSEYGQLGAHRLVWAMHGFADPQPPFSLDHINRVKADNRIENLRIADDHMQAMNQSDRVAPNPGRCIVRFDTRWRLHIIRRGVAMDRRIFKCFGQALKARNDFERLERAS